jgi:hypothetical protein
VTVTLKERFARFATLVEAMESAEEALSLRPDVRRRVVAARAYFERAIDQIADKLPEPEQETLRAAAEILRRRLPDRRPRRTGPQIRRAAKDFAALVEVLDELGQTRWAEEGRALLKRLEAALGEATWRTN